MKTFIWATDFVTAISDCDAERIVSVFLHTEDDRTHLRISNEVVLTAARCLVAEGKAEPFNVLFPPDYDEPMTCTDHGQLPSYPKELDISINLIRRLTVARGYRKSKGLDNA